MIQIDYDNIHKRALAAEVCPYNWIKKQLNFRLKKQNEKYNCWICKFRYSQYMQGKVYQTCEMIGVAPLSYGEIDGMHICDNFTLCHERAAVVKAAVKEKAMENVKNCLDIINL